MGNKTNFDVHKRAMVEALKKSLGIVTSAAASVGITRACHYNWMKTDAAYAAEVESISDMALDLAESKLFERIDRKDITAIIFFLKCRGKKRGYVERQEITGADGGPLQVAVSQQWDAEYRKRQCPVVKPE